MEQNAAHHESFIVRVRLERRSECEPPDWQLRGQVEHATTGQAWHFASTIELAHILDAYLHGRQDQASARVE